MFIRVHTCSYIHTCMHDYACMIMHASIPPSLPPSIHPSYIQYITIHTINYNTFHSIPLHSIPFHYIADRHTDIHHMFLTIPCTLTLPQSPEKAFQEQRISDPRDPRGRSNGPHGVPVVQGRPVPTEDRLGALVVWSRVFHDFPWVFPWNQRGVLWIFP